MRSERSFLAALVAAMATTLVPVAATGYCLAGTEREPAEFVPVNGCLQQGVPLFHLSQCVPYHLLENRSGRIGHDAFSEALAAAFAAWTAPNAACTPGISGIELAPVADVNIAHFDAREGGRNVFGFVQGPWPHGDALALTTLSFVAETGQILDVDMEVHEDLPWFVARDPDAGAPADGYDLRAAMAHEVGHVLGLAHSSHAESVMYPAYQLGSTSQRRLAADDGEGVCDRYPDRQTRHVWVDKVTASKPCDLAPAVVSSCGDPAVTHGCAVAWSPSSTAPASWRGGGGLTGAAILGALWWLARRRPRRA